MSNSTLKNLQNVAEKMAEHQQETAQNSRISPMRRQYRDSDRVIVPSVIENNLNEPRRPRPRSLADFEYLEIETGQTGHSNPMFGCYVKVIAKNDQGLEQIVSCGLHPTFRDPEIYINHVLAVIEENGYVLPIRNRFKYVN